MPGVGSLYADSLERLDYIGPEGLIVGNDGGDAAVEMALVACCSTLLPVTRRYVYAPGENTPLVWYEGAGTADRRWLHTDERGSVIAVTDAGGAALAVNTYDEYGQPGAGNLGRFGYTGQMWLPSLGLNYHRARMYSPALGRFVQPDPIGYGDGLNWYDYVGGDPVNRTDPLGLDARCGEEWHEERGSGSTITSSTEIKVTAPNCRPDATFPSRGDSGPAPSAPGGGPAPAPQGGPPCAPGVACKLPPLKPVRKCTLANNFCGLSRNPFHLFHRESFPGLSNA